jgi:hypothetical protein
LVETNLENATISNCHVYGLSAWNLIGDFKDQSNLTVTPSAQQEGIITVNDKLLLAFLYLL